jgi:hypothetical protein
MRSETKQKMKITKYIFGNCGKSLVFLKKPTEISAGGGSNLLCTACTINNIKKKTKSRY